MVIRIKESIKAFSILWLSAAVILTFANSTLAQEIRGSINGRVTDPQGAVVAGATVTVTQADTNVSQTAITNEEGRYTAPYLNPGIYAVTVEAPGYKKLVRGNIELRVEDRLELNLKLELGSINETVNVTDTTPLIETNDASMGQVMDQRLISELPTPDGNTYILTRLGPGIVDSSDPEFTRPHDLINTTKQSSNGIPNSNEYTVDNAPNSGLNNRDGITTRPAFIPSADSVQEFKVNTFSTDASFGRAAGATINVATKSGKNTPFGSLYYFSRNDKLAANKFFANRSGQKRPVLRYHRFGATIGGPVFLPRFWAPDLGEGGPALYDGRNRTFFFFAFEGLNDSMPNAGYFTVPSMALRRGDFSDLLGGTLVQNTTKLSKDIPRDPKTGCGGGKKDTIIPLFHYDGSPVYKGQIYDPWTAKAITKCNPTTGKIETRVERLPFAGNIIPQNRINPISRSFLNYFPLPNVEGNSDGKNNFYSPNSEITKYKNETVRIDHTYSEKHKAYVRLNHTFRDNDRRPWTGVVNGIMPSGEKWDRGSVSLLYDHVYILSPTTVLNIRVDGTHAADSFTVPSKGLFSLGMAGFSPQALAMLPASDYFPSLSVSGYTSLGNALPDAANSQVYSTHVKLQKSTGNHHFTFGYDLRFYNQTDTPEENAAGSYSFSDSFVKGPIFNSSGVTGQSFAGFLLGLASGSVDRKPGAKTRQTFQSFFVQDNWKVNGRLTLNLGLRYEYEGPVREKYNRAVRGFDPNLIINPVIEKKAADNYAKFYNNLAATNHKYLADFPTPEKVATSMRGGYVFADENHTGLWEPIKTHFMPRLGAAFRINKKTVIRGGLSFTNAPIGVGGASQVGFAQTTRIVNSVSEGEYGCSTCGTFDNPFPLGIIEMPDRPVLTRFVGKSYGNVRPIGTRKTFKYMSWSFGLQRQLPGKWVVEASYVGNRSSGRLVWHDINTVPGKFYSTSTYRDTNMQEVIDELATKYPNPFYQTLGSDNDSSLNTSKELTLERLLRPNPFFEDINMPFYDGLTYYHAGQFRVQKRFSHSFSGFVTYTWAKSMQQNSLRNEFDTEYEKVISGSDVPHRFTVAGLFEIPIGRRRQWGSEMPGVLNAIIGGWQLGATYVWQKGTPLGLGNVVFNGDFSKLKTKIDSKSVVSTSGEKKLQGALPSNVITNIFGIDLRTSGFYFTDDLVRDPKTGELDFRRQREDDRIELSKNVKTLPTRVTWLRGQPRSNLDFSFMKKFYFREKTHLQLRCEMINALNHVLFDDITMDPKKVDFGTVNNQRNPARYFQLGLRIVF